MDLLNALILGIIEGATEFLPISSTGHLIVVSNWLGLEQDSIHVGFQIIIQMAAIFAVIVKYPRKFTFRHTALWIKVTIAFIPLAIVGFLFKDQIENLFSNQRLIPSMFILGGIFLVVLERFYVESSDKTSSVEDVSYSQAIWIGCAQIVALIPGTSRAGATISGAMCVGVSRKASAEFSFLLALPVLGCVSAYQLLKHYEEFSGEYLIPLAVGFVTAFIVSFFSINIFLWFMDKFSLAAFGYYRIAFGGLLFFMLY
ncbi:MAG: undecaprenyl-diphosphate phosphatase [Sneathiella sp.]|nr:undecaprenyl-diphosphate phosphatase [Sneathiella sp.]